MLQKYYLQAGTVSQCCCWALGWIQTLMHNYYINISYRTYTEQYEGSPKAGSAQSLYCSGVQTVEVPVWNNIKVKIITWHINWQHVDTSICFFFDTFDRIFHWWSQVWIHTRHVNHPAVTILQQVPSFTVNAAGGDAVCGEVFRVYGSRLAISPRRREVLKLKEQTAYVFPQYISTQDYNK